jgi:hypothetical protein
MPVIAGVDNDAALTTSITASMGVASLGTAAFRVRNETHETGLQVTSVDSNVGLGVSNRTVSGTGLTVSNSSADLGVGLFVTHTSAGISGAAIDARTDNSGGMTGGVAISAFTPTPGGDALYAFGRYRGLYAVGTDGEAVRAYSYNTNGMVGYGKLNGVVGYSDNQNASGVYGQNNGRGFGVTGLAGVGLWARDTGAGVWGNHGNAGPGVLGTSSIGIGVVGRTSGSVAILAENQSGRADATAVTAQGGSGVGLQASGDRAAVRLSPAAIAGAPTTGAHEMGELMVDSNGDLFLCKAAGTPGTWVRVA